MPQGFIVGIPQPLFKENADGAMVPAAGYRVYTYAENSVTPKATYSDGQLASLNANPIVADADGRFRIFIAQGETIKCVIKTDADVSVETYDYLKPMIADPSAGSVTAVPTGGMVFSTYSAVPTGFLLCDGSAVSRSTYADLHALAAADSYPDGNGNGTTTFNLPDMRGRAAYGKATSGTGSTAGTSAAFGSMDHTHTGPSHTHTTEVPTDGWGGTQAAGVSPQGTMLASDGAVLNLTIAQTDQTITSSASGTGNTGTGNAPGVAGYWFIKT